MKRNGQAYLEGWDTWSELSELVSSSAVTQPVRLGIVQVSAKGVDCILYWLFSFSNLPFFLKMAAEGPAWHKP